MLSNVQACTDYSLMLNDVNCIIADLGELFGEVWSSDLQEFMTDKEEGDHNPLRARLSALKDHIRDTKEFKEEMIAQSVAKPVECCGKMLIESEDKQLHYREIHHRAHALPDKYKPDFELFLVVMKESNPVPFLHMSATDRPIQCPTLPDALKKVGPGVGTRGYVYLLQDPVLAPKTDSAQPFLRFIQSVFYVGKGTTDGVSGHALRSWDHIKNPKGLQDNTRCKSDYIEKLQAYPFEHKPQHILIFRRCSDKIATMIEDSIINLLVVRDLILTNNQQGKNSAGNHLLHSQRIALGSQALYRAYKQYVEGTVPARIEADDFRRELEHDDWKDMPIFSKLFPPKD